MRARTKAALVAGFTVALGILLTVLAERGTIAVLDPAGLIGSEERELMIIAAALMLLVVIPVFILTAVIAVRYRAGNPRAAYAPELDHNALEEFIWWAVPCSIILVLAVITWESSHALDPYRPLDSTMPPITIEVVALDWKWLFIYPAQGIATVNEVVFPAGTPINFEITADAPMNSFWIPQLGGQVYAMSGMVTRLHLEADHPGSFAGASSNFSGTGFAGMTFTAKAVGDDDFSSWVQGVKASAPALTHEAYAALALPSEDAAVAYYGTIDAGLYTDAIMKYMGMDAASSTPDARILAPAMQMDMTSMPGMVMPAATH